MSAGLTCNYDLDHSFILQTDASTAIPYFFLRSNLSHFDAILQFILQLPALAYSFLGHPYISTIFVGPVGSMISPLFKHNSLCDAQLRPDWRQRFAIASDRPTPTVQFQCVPSPHFKRKIILLSRLLSRFLSIFFFFNNPIVPILCKFLSYRIALSSIGFLFYYRIKNCNTPRYRQTKLHPTISAELRSWSPSRSGFLPFPSAAVRIPGLVNVAFKIIVDTENRLMASLFPSISSVVGRRGLPEEGKEENKKIHCIFL